MTSLLPLVLVTAAAAAAADHEKANPLYRQLRDPGVAVGRDLEAPLPAPAMPDAAMVHRAMRICV